jgi:hypothetical protein
MSAEGSTPEEALRRLEERLDRASAAAERLMAEAAGAAAGRAGRNDREPPPAGWQTPQGETEQRGDGDLEALIALARSLRDLIPPELQQRLINAVREVLQALRDLLDWYLERLDRKRAEPAQVQDIPIL